MTPKSSTPKDYQQVAKHLAGLANSYFLKVLVAIACTIGMAYALSNDELPTAGLPKPGQIYDYPGLHR